MKFIILENRELGYVSISQLSLRFFFQFLDYYLLCIIFFIINLLLI